MAFNFLRLPAEIRNKIYGYVFNIDSQEYPLEGIRRPFCRIRVIPPVIEPDNYESNVVFNHGWKGLASSKASYALLDSCEQISKEAFLFWWSAIELDVVAGFGLDDQVPRFMESLTEILLSNLRYLTLDLDQLRHVQGLEETCGGARLFCAGRGLNIKIVTAVPDKITWDTDDLASIRWWHGQRRHVALIVNACLDILPTLTGVEHLALKLRVPEIKRDEELLTISTTCLSKRNFAAVIGIDKKRLVFTACPKTKSTDSAKDETQ